MNPRPAGQTERRDAPTIASRANGKTRSLIAKLIVANAETLTGFWSGGMASAAFALWLLGAVIGVLRAARRIPPAPAVPAQGAPAPEAAR
jgi:hypothetical protein